MASDRIVIIGAGKVGRSLHRAALTAGVDVTLERARSVSRRASTFGERAPTLVILAVPDRAIADTGDAVAHAVKGHRATAIVHTSGRLDAEVLAGARSERVSVGQMHPLVSFVDRSFGDVEGATMLLAGDARAIRIARRFAIAIGMIPRRFDALPRPLYHAAAALVANSAAALAEAACELLASSGVSKKISAAMVGPLLESVGRNVRRVGLPEALSGPVRRGDALAVAGHLEALENAAKKRKNLRWVVDLYRAGVLAQIPMAGALGEAPKSGLAEIQARVAHAREMPLRSALPSRKR